MNACSDKVYDCVVIGGGVIGTFAARELCKFRGAFLLLESGNDVAVGVSGRAVVIREKAIVVIGAGPAGLAAVAARYFDLAA